MLNGLKKIRILKDIITSGCYFNLNKNSAFKGFFCCKNNTGVY